MAIEDGLPRAHFWFFWKSTFLSFRKFWTKILDVEYNLFYNPVKFQLERVYIPAYTKMTNSDKSKKNRIMYSDLEICHFYTTQNTKYFTLIFCTQLEVIIAHI
jgi:murein L,D-transpeptidase YafK